MTSAESTRSPISITVTALLVIVCCLLLGRWQLGRVDRPVDGYSAEPAAVTLDALVPAGASVSPGDVARQVTLTGTYDGRAQSTDPGHTVAGLTVYWVVTPLVLPDRSRVQVVRGWVTAPGQPLAQPPAGAVTLTARLEQGQLAGGQGPWRLTSGYLVRTAQSPPDPLSLQPVPVPPPPNQAPGEFHLQNAIYVTQWWLLAVIMVLFWWRLVRAHRTQPDDAAPVGARG